MHMLMGVWANGHAQTGHVSEIWAVVRLHTFTHQKVAHHARDTQWTCY